MILAIPLILIAIALAWGWFSSGIIIRQPRLANEFNPKSFGYAYETFKVLTADKVELVGWFVPAKSPSKSTIIINHGWGANRSDILGTSIFLAGKYNLVYYDFRNHGNSGGSQTSLGRLEVTDFLTIIQYVKSQKKEFSEKLAVLGFSLGGAVAITGAALNPEVMAVAAESPFASYKEVVYRYGTKFFYAPRFMIPITLFFAQHRLGFDPDEYSPLHHVSRLGSRPLFIIQGGSDERMPVSEGQRLMDLAPGPKELWVVGEAGHIGAKEVNPAEYERRVLEFFDKALGSK